MNNNSILLATKLMSDGVYNFLNVSRYVLFGIVIACAITLIVTTLMQSNETDSTLNAFTGAKQESYYSQNKGASRDSILKRITIAMAIIIAVCIIAFFVTEIFLSRGGAA